MRTLMSRLRGNTLFEIVFTVALALGLALAVQAYAVKPYKIPSGSMEPTLDVGQRVIVDRFSQRLGSAPGVGDIVVFRPPLGADAGTCANPRQGAGSQYPCGLARERRDSRTFIKRIVAVGGDTIAIVDGHVIRNGKRTSEPFIASCAGDGDCNFPEPITVPRDHVFVMGDNRGASDDSRYWGPIPSSWVIGRAVATYWPPNRIGGV
jgi:signal peptidase I